MLHRREPGLLREIVGRCLVPEDPPGELSDETILFRERLEVRVNRPDGASLVSPPGPKAVMGIAPPLGRKCG
jgi:hypothetical protein